MRSALLCAAALLAVPAFADEVVASNGVDSVRLSDSQCSSDKVLEQIEPGMRAQLKDATAVIDGQSLKACWILDGKSAHLVYEDGDEGIVPLSEFRKPG
jgi:hypothetical protein